LTFDDAYRNFAEVAWPIMHGHGFPAALFVPTAYPDGELERFWWDRLAQAFATTPRREPLPTPLGLLPLGTPAERAAAYTQVKRHVKDLAHVETLATTREVCAALRHESGRHEVLGPAVARNAASVEPCARRTPPRSHGRPPHSDRRGRGYGIYAARIRA
jgi:hypothetical protein